MTKQLLHSEVPPQYTWNAPSVFVSHEAWEQELIKVGEELAAVAKYPGHLADGAALLVEALQARDEFVRRALVLMVYADMASAVDSNDQAAAAISSRARSLYGQVLAAFAFVDPELIAIGLVRLHGWANSEPRLAIYAHAFDDLFRKQAHIRSGEVEELLGMLADPFSGAYLNESLLTNADFQLKPARSSTGEELPVTQSTFYELMASPDREVRRTAFESLTDEYLAHKNTLANNLVTSIKQNVFKMRARRHTSTLAASLFEDNIPVEVFHNLIAVFKQNIPTWHRYWALKKKALNVDELHYYDIWAPIATQRPTVTYEQGINLICAGLAPLGEEYVHALRKGCLQDRWVDVYPNQGKVAGAFSTGAPGTHPFIMTSFHDDLFSLSTLAHELGHSMHTYLTFENQPVIYCNYSLFVAEVASNFNQALVRAHLLKTNDDPQFQLTLLEEAFANFLRYFFIMPTLARFELEVHERLERGEGVTADTLITLMNDLFTEGFGSAMASDRDRHGIIWATFGHLFADYYVYQYATGISAANALANRVLAGTPHAGEDYLCFLKAGNSVYSLDALKIAGVDLTKPEPVLAGFEVLAGMVDRLEKTGGLISVIIPALNEAENILKTIESVRQQDQFAEIIVVDGGSIDGTPEIARSHATVISGPRGRAVQMNAGARQASGDVLLFLPSDSALAPGALAQLQKTLDNPYIAGGSFTLIFDTDNFWLRFYAFCSTIDWLCFRYGDQGIFVRRTVFETLGGYVEIPLMEDIDLMRRLPRYGQRFLIRHYPVTTSARRFVEHGVVRQEVLNVALVGLWFLGVKPQTLAHWYAARRVKI